MVICEYCDSHLENGITTCPNCGAKVTYVEPAVEEEGSETIVLETEQTEQTETNPLKELWEDLTGGFGKTAATIGGATLLGSLFGKKSRREPLRTPLPERRPAPDSGMHSRAGRPGGPGLQRGGHHGGMGGGTRGGMGGGPKCGMGGHGGRR